MSREAEPLSRLTDIQKRLEDLRAETVDLGDRVRGTLADAEASMDRRRARERVQRLHQDLEAALHEVEGLRIAMHTRGVIEQAKGMIMITLKVDEEAAFDVLVQRSQRNHQKLVDVARDVVNTGIHG
jgi:hypothetical protein